MKKPLLILTGPTAVGKTQASIQLAKQLNGEIISADSMQVYKGMDIGTAKITLEEMSGVPHHLIDILCPDEEFNVVKFKTAACEAMEDIYKRNKLPIIVGGTGFYIQAVLKDIHFEENNNSDDYRQELENIAKTKGAEYIHHMLMQVDENSAKSIHANNVKKVIRALEYFQQTGKKISEHNEIERQKESPYEYLYFVLNHIREVLYERIDKRVDMMMEQGLLEEVKYLYAKGYSRNLVSMQGLGYKEIIAYLEGECSLEEAVYILKRDTRHFAKRQITWFKREKDIIWINKNEYKSEDEVLKTMLNIAMDKFS